MARYVTKFYDGIEINHSIKPGKTVVLDATKIKRVEIESKEVAVNMGKGKMLITDTTSVGCIAAAGALLAFGIGYAIRSMLD